MAVDQNQRLGTRELGAYAFEEQMPDSLKTTLVNEDSTNALSGVVPKLASLLRRDDDVYIAFLCSENAVQVTKLPNDGGRFCGYRNMQMLCLALGKSTWHETPNLLDRKLKIPELQGMIEHAWDQGINAQARNQTGGIKGTRKHVGTLEVEALCLSLNIECTGSVFKGGNAWNKVLDFIQDYYQAATPESLPENGVGMTIKPPVYLQRRSHSVMVVGIEILHSGKRRLLVFDPAWNWPSAMEGPSSPADSTKKLGLREYFTLRRYRKNESYLKRFDEFETLSID